MISYGFCLRNSTRRDGGAGRLYLRVVYGGESRSVTTSYRVYAEEWDPVRRRLLIPYARSERSLLLADYEGAMMCDIRRLENLIAKLNRRGGYSLDELMGQYRSIMAGGSLCEYVGKVAVELEQSGHERTAQTYLTAVRRLISFNGGRDILPEQFTPGLISGFQRSLKAQNISLNTISFYMRTLRAIYHRAVSEGFMYRRSESPFASVYTGVPPTRKLALTSVELSRLSRLDPTDLDMRNGMVGEELPEHLGQALAMFLFCYHARGMCFVDMANLRKGDLRDGVVRYRRRKTGQQIELRVQPAMRRIIDWFAPRTAGSDYLFPVITDPDKEPRLQYESGLRLQNQRLKKIASLVGIEKKISTHCARHSWATVAKNTGLPLAVISEGLGHTNQKTTEIYLASLERSILDRASRLVSEAISSQRTVRGTSENVINDPGGMYRQRNGGSRRGAFW